MKRYFSSVEKNTDQNYSSNNPSKKSRNQFKFERQVPISIGWKLKLCINLILQSRQPQGLLVQFFFNQILMYNCKSVLFNSFPVHWPTISEQGQRVSETCLNKNIKIIFFPSISKFPIGMSFQSTRWKRNANTRFRASKI